MPWTAWVRLNSGLSPWPDWHDQVCGPPNKLTSLATSGVMPLVLSCMCGCAVAKTRKASSTKAWPTWVAALRFGQTMCDSFAQCSIDAGLPALSSRLEGFEHIGIYPHVQRGALHCCGWPAAPALERSLLPIGGYCCCIIGVVGAIGCSMCNRCILHSLSLDAIPISRGGFSSSFGHKASFLVWMRAAAIWLAPRPVHAAHRQAPRPHPLLPP